MKSEHTKIIVVVVLLAAAVGIFYWFGRTPAPLPSQVRFVWWIR